MYKIYIHFKYILLYILLICYIISLSLSCNGYLPYVCIPCQKISLKLEKRRDKFKNDNWKLILRHFGVVWCHFTVCYIWCLHGYYLAFWTRTLLIIYHIKSSTNYHLFSLPKNVIQIRLIWTQALNLFYRFTNGGDHFWAHNIKF